MANKKVNIEDLINYRLITREKGSGTRDILESILHEKNLNIDIFSLKLEIGNFNAIKDIVIHELGITFVYKEVVKKELLKGSLAQIRVKDFNEIREFNIVYLKDDVLVEHYNKFWDFLMNTPN